LLRPSPPIEPFRQIPRGMILSEGAGAVLLRRGGPMIIERSHGGGCYRKRAEAETILTEIVRDLNQAKTDFVISSANGTFVDKAECSALSRVIPKAVVYTAKPALGESIGAAGLWQIIIGAKALHSGKLPPLLHAEPTIRLRISASLTPVVSAHHAIILSCGVNQQAAGLRLSIQ
jgi:3-oxoacyl-(acyl-carrier-protein) synthase